MPTASPIISASVGVVVEIVVRLATVRTPASVMATPIAAVSSGSPAARSDANVTARTANARSTPRTSVIPIPSVGCGYIAPPSVTVNFASAGGFAAASTSVTADGGRSVEVTSNWMDDRALSLSGEMVPTASLANGSSTEVTCCTLAMAWICASMAACWSAIGPAVDVKTIWPVVPEACGKRCASVSMPRCDSVPGIE